MESFHICLRNKPIGTSTSSRLLFDSNSALPRLNRSSGLSPILATPHTLPIYINSSSRNSHATQAGGCFGRAASGFVLWVMRPFAGLYRISSTFGPRRGNLSDRRSSGSIGYLLATTDILLAAAAYFAAVLYHRFVFHQFILHWVVLLSAPKTFRMAKNNPNRCTEPSVIIALV